jgi:hypothetical protein
MHLGERDDPGDQPLCAGQEQGGTRSTPCPMDEEGGWLICPSVVNDWREHVDRRTKANEEVTRVSGKLKPLTPLLKGEGLHALLLPMRLIPHGELDTST